MKLIVKLGVSKTAYSVTVVPSFPQRTEIVDTITKLSEIEDKETPWRAEIVSTTREILWSAIQESNIYGYKISIKRFLLIWFKVFFSVLCNVSLCPSTSNILQYRKCSYFKLLNPFTLDVICFNLSVAVIMLRFIRITIQNRSSATPGVLMKGQARLNLLEPVSYLFRKNSQCLFRLRSARQESTSLPLRVHSLLFILFCIFPAKSLTKVYLISWPLLLTRTNCSRC